MSQGHHLYPRGYKEVMVERDQSRLGAGIYPSNLDQCPRPKSKKLVMEKVLVNPTLQFSLLTFFIPKILAIATQEFVIGMCVSM